MNLQKFYPEDKFRLLIYLHSMTGALGEAMHGSGTRFQLNSTDRVQLEIK